MKTNIYKNKEKKLQKIFDSFEDTSTISCCSGKGKSKGCLSISWSEKGRGFGVYTFFQNDKGQWVIDNECDGKKSIKRVMERLIDSLPLTDAI